MSNLPKMLSKREIELEELEEAKYVQSLRDDIEKLQEQLSTTVEALTSISKTKVPFRNGCFHWEDFSEDALKAQKALAKIEDKKKPI
ncbi:hypothetical protein ABLU29_06995 [Lactococcus lactis]|uniref:Uncharacterized protein n=1 Tax=Lactococcus lactis TaxID=1358 RepID=A0AAW8UH14_9LACT|nr:hypothetical protein [Lactococcus lactis]MDT2880314.1 hypothetical protein [Lactococcus lactis]MDT2945362.1 hypothetical protein [Lactococcus lactis]MDT2947528.1 hypothetical protein [Lactococcus lactis]